MEIRFKTLDETRNSHVHVAVRTDRGTEEVIEFVRQNAEVTILTTDQPAQLPPTVTSECDEQKRVLAQQGRRIRELERLLTLSAVREDESMELTEKLEAEASEARRCMTELVELTAELANAERAIQILSAQLGRVSGAVHSSELVHDALRRDWTSWSEREAAALTSAIRSVRDALGSPSLPERASAPTSQA